MEGKVSLFTEGSGGLDCSSCNLSNVSQDRYLSYRWGLHLLMEDHHFSVNGESLAPPEGSSACPGWCGRWVSCWQHHLVF